MCSGIAMESNGTLITNKSLKFKIKNKQTGVSACLDFKCRTFFAISLSLGLQGIVYFVRQTINFVGGKIINTKSQLL